MKLIVGLGNPGKKYEDTRHNIGFKVACALADKYNIRLGTKAFNSLIGKGRIFSEGVIIALPQAYMNRSGEAVGMMRARKKTVPADILVICDDVNLELGIIRIRAGGSAGGHKGLASIIERLGSGDFTRLRVGIGKERQGSELSGYVLAPFKRNEAGLLGDVIKSALECCEAWIKEGAQSAANRFNSRNRKD